jgi:hypothetical protein
MAFISIISNLLIVFEFQYLELLLIDIHFISLNHSNWIYFDFFQKAHKKTL